MEAYYGRCWSFEARQRCLALYPELGLENYLYAPKSDRRLRSEWSSPWDIDTFDHLSRLFADSHTAGLKCGVGLSPLGLTDIAVADQRIALREKIAQINELSCHWLGIFFDDMPSVGKSMARYQLEIVEYIASYSNAKKLIVCPSYYTSDQLLEKLFGPRPSSYWEELGKNLPAEVEIFWTGEQVCSRTFKRENIEFIAGEFRRLPTLWDNYPVNDGEKSSRFLNIRPFTQRPGWLQEYTAGHFANPMNQAYLSLLPLATLPCSYGADDDTQSGRWEAAARKLCPELYRKIWQDSAVFQNEGLDTLDSLDRKQGFRHYYSSESGFAGEITDWLEGAYTFDPACLTG